MALPLPRPEAGAEPARRSRWSAAAAPVALLAAYLALAVVLFARVWGAPSTALAGAGTDPQLFVWAFRWVPFALSHGLNPLFTTYLDYPAGMNLMWTGNSLLLGLVLSPLTLVAGPALAYNVAAALGPALSAWCAWWAIRRYVRRSAAAAAGGLLYGFSPALIAQASLGHVHVTFAVFSPLALIVADEFLVRRRLSAFKAGASLGLAAALQLLVGEETLLITGIGAIVGIGILAVLFRARVRSALPPVAQPTAAAVVIFGVLAAFPLATQFLGPQRPVGLLQPANFYVSDLLNFVVPSPAQLVSPGWISWLSAHFTGDVSSRDAYLGLPLLAWLVVTARLLWGDVAVRWAALELLALGVLSLGPALHVAGVVTRIPLPWALVQPLPGFDNVLPGRLMILGFLPAGILLARGLDGLLEARPRAAALAPLIGLLVLMPNLEPASPSSIPAFFRSPAVARIPAGSVALVAPFSGLYSTDAMAWQAAAGMRFRMPEGYGFTQSSRLSPPPTALQGVMLAVQLHGTAPPLTSELLQELRRDLVEARVATIVAGPMPHDELMVALLGQVIGGPPQRTGGVAVWWDVQQAMTAAAVR